MSSVAGVRLGLCLFRYGPQTGVPVVVFCRKNHSVANSKSMNSGKLPSCEMSTVAGQKQTKPFTVDFSELRKEMHLAESLRRFRRFVTDPGVASNIVYSLDPWDHRSTPVLIECNPGPGVLTRALLDTGCNVVALENDAEFLPGLKRLEKSTGGQLKVLHCDFFRLDPWTESIVRAPSMYSSDLMEQLNISEVPWDMEVPVKVFGILNHTKERNLLWKFLYSLYERLSIFRYGRIEFNFFMSEHLYQRLLAKPGEYQRYQALSVLYNVACEVQLLHKEESSTFFTPKKFKGSSVVKTGASSGSNLCLVRITPRRNLFSEHFTPCDGKVFINMVKQCLVKRTSKLIHRLESWNPGEGEQLLQNLQLPEDIKTGDIYPEEYKLLFEILTHSEDFNQGFAFDDVHKDVSCVY
ncbi:dimethyladenosine transferase 2, mitochondrial [Pyxicephalus adspersus]|uniref:rRNA adenine N(6)-methyltransferase n=1 Tax=Pyxicephalus adspersus TaxID=30357 RepID=A0AAV3APE7_PYXAD|nr:TPA: hypothetical protein GDO54_011099 [Pyxicephalus adspersus]